MELDKFLITEDPPGFCKDEALRDEWCRKWSRPVNRSLFDTVKLTEQECSDMLPQIETMKYGGSDLLLSPALKEFVLHMTGVNEQGVSGSNYILFKKTIITETWKQHGNGAVMTMTPVLDAYFFFDESDVADVVVTIGVFKTECDDGRTITGTFQRPVWVMDHNLFSDEYLIRPLAKLKKCDKIKI